LLFVLFLEPVVPNDESGVLLGSELAVGADAHILFVFILAELSDGVLHLLQALVELLNLVTVALLALLAVSQVAHNVVLVELHQARQVLVLVLGIDDLLHVLLELHDDCFLFFGTLLL